MRARPSGLRALLAAAALVAVGAGAAAGILLTRSHAVKAITALEPNSVGAIDPKSNKLVGAIPTGNLPSRIAVGGGSVWVMNGGDSTVQRIGQSDLKVKNTFSTGTTLAGIAYGGGALFVAHSFDGKLTAIGYDQNFSTFAYERQPYGGELPRFPEVTVAGTAIWLTSYYNGLIRVDPSTQRPVERISLRAVPLAIASGDGSVWFAGYERSSRAGFVARIDPKRPAIAATVSLPAIPTTLAVGYGAVWVAVNSRNTVWRIDPKTSAVEQTIQVGDGPFAVAVGEGSVWVVNAKDATVSRIDPKKNAVVATISVGAAPRDVAVGGGRVWVAAS